MNREPKPYWREVPQDVREAIAALLGSSVRRGVRVFGGYGPSATFRLFLEDGRTVFTKGAGVRANEHHWQVLPNEERAYREVEAIRPFAPRYHGTVRREGWLLLLLEDLHGATRVPPWTQTLAESAVTQIAAWHARGLDDPAELPPLELEAFTGNWQALQCPGPDREQFLSLFGALRGEAERWLDGSGQALSAHEAQLAGEDQPRGILHLDIRSDNLVFQGEKLVLFDWADICRGPLALDLAGFLPSLSAEGGPPAQAMTTRYREAMRTYGITFEDWAVGAAAASVAGYFASRAGRPGVAGLPRLRAVQRLQLGPALRWAAQLLRLPSPPPIADKA